MKLITEGRGNPTKEVEVKLRCDFDRRVCREAFYTDTNHKGDSGAGIKISVARALSTVRHRYEGPEMLG